MKKARLMMTSAAVGCLALGGAAVIPPVPRACAQDAGTVSYAEDIQPIFKGWCVSCHSPGGFGFESSGLDLTSYEGLMKGTKFGPMVIPRSPDTSNLVVMIEGKARISMPLGHKPLPSCLRDSIWNWVFQGAQNN